MRIMFYSTVWVNLFKKWRQIVRAWSNYSIIWMFLHFFEVVVIVFVSWNQRFAPRCFQKIGLSHWWTYRLNTLASHTPAYKWFFASYFFEGLVLSLHLIIMRQHSCSSVLFELVNACVPRKPWIQVVVFRVYHNINILRLKRRSFHINIGVVIQYVSQGVVLTEYLDGGVTLFIKNIIFLQLRVNAEYFRLIFNKL